MAASDPVKHMRQALALAGRGRGRVEPNPMVGCVLVRQGRVIGRGFHRVFGGAHAEVAALADCRQHGRDPAGCDLYVTLEPCAHRGKTPPCTAALIEARPRKVFAAMLDPFPLVAGRGVQALREAGIGVEVGLCADEARRLNEPYLKRLATGLPFVIAKWAQTLDGLMASEDPAKRWISNEQSRRRVHELRARVDAVMVGVGTVIADNPLLTARDVRRLRRACRVVVDPLLRIPLTARLLTSLPKEPPVVIGHAPGAPTDRAAALADRGVELVELPVHSASHGAGSPRRLDLVPLLRRLVDGRDATNVLVEGGPTLLASMWEQNLIDQALVYVAPRIARTTGVGDFVLRQARRLGDDMELDYRVSPERPA